MLVVATLVAAAIAAYLIHKDGYEIGREHGRKESDVRNRSRNIRP